MARIGNVDGEGSKRLKGVRRLSEGTKYTRYTEEQIEVLEKVYAVCSNPNRFQRAQIMREEPTLNGIDNKHLKVWFQNRRCREKQRKDNQALVAENNKIRTLNKVLREENDCLLNKVSQLICENEHLRNQVLNLTSPTTTTDNIGRVTEESSPQLAMRIPDNYNGLVVLAEETKNEFLSKAIGTAINWIPMPMPSPSIVGAIYISSSCIGVAARACAVVPFEPIKTIELLKDRVSWCRNCRNLEVLAKYPASNGGTIELIYTQYYSHTTMVCARDFWTLRYTSFSDGSFVVCEKSVSGSDVVPSSPAALEFVRGKMLASGYLIRPCDGGSTIHLVAHFDLEASSVPEIIRPIYESCEFVAKKMIVPALQYIEHVASEPTETQTLSFTNVSAASIRYSGKRLSRGFNDAINGFTEDGWTLMNADSYDDFVISMKRITDGVHKNYDSVICVKTSLLLQNVFPGKLLRLLKERRASWIGFNFTDHSSAFSRATHFTFPGIDTHNLSESAVPLGETNHENEILEIIRFVRIVHYHQSNDSSGDIYHLQISNGTEDNNFGPCSEFIFATVDRNMPDNAPLLSSGFRIFSLASNPINLLSNEAPDLTNAPPHSLLIMAFQFPFNTHIHENVLAMAKQFVQNVISVVKNMSVELMSPRSVPLMNLPEPVPAMEIHIPNSNFVLNFANLICQSYRSALGVEMLGFNSQSIDSVELIENHQYPILCFSITSLPVCLYANQAGLNMLETTIDNLQSLNLNSILDGSKNVSLDSVLPTLMKQQYAILPPGYFLSLMTPCISYDQAVVWLVLDADCSAQCIALAFTNWSFI